MPPPTTIPATSSLTTRKPRLIAFCQPRSGEACSRGVTTDGFLRCASRSAESVFSRARRAASSSPLPFSSFATRLPSRRDQHLPPDDAALTQIVERGVGFVEGAGHRRHLRDFSDLGDLQQLLQFGERAHVRPL